MNKHSRGLIILLVVVTTLPLMAQDNDEEPFVPTYSLGDQTLRINLGLFLPLFFALGPDGIESTNLTPGGAGSLAWASYLTDSITVGAEVGGSFSLSPNLRTLWMAGVSATGSYIIQRYPFEFPITLGLGVNVSKVADRVKVDPILKAGGSFYWNYSSQWAFGLNLLYWFVPQVYTTYSVAGPSESRLGNFLEITLSALYHI